MRDDSGRITHYLSLQRDVTEQRMAEAARDLFAEALQVVAEPIMITDEDHRIVAVNHAFERFTGYRRDEVMGQSPLILYLGVDDSAYGLIVAALDEHRAVREHVRIRTKDGRILHTVHTVTPNHDENAPWGRNISSFTDVTDLVEVADRLHALATTDALTGLANRRAGEAALAARLKEGSRTGEPLAVALCDIDHFKQINDTLGHSAGDRVLTSIADRLRKAVRDYDVPVRWGGEEFLLIFFGADAQAAVASAERVRAVIADTPDMEAGTVTVSIGIAQASADEGIDDLVRRADEALYQAKASGRNRVVLAR